MEDENDFVMLKIWKFDLALIKTQSCQFFESLSTKKPWKNKENCSPPKCYKITKKWKKIPILHFGQHQSIFRDKKLFIYFLDPILGHPVYQFLAKPEFSYFTVSGSGLLMGHRYWKYVCVIMLVKFVYYGYCSREPWIV